MTLTITTIGAVAVSLALIAVVAVLTWHGSITGEAAMTFFSGVAGGGVAVGAHTAGARSARATVREVEAERGS